MKIVTADQMRRLEQACIPLGVSLDDLMERAGLEVARCARSLLGGAAGRRIVVLVGPGNNGADGFVAARHLQRWGAEVTAHVLGRRLQSDPKRELALHEGIFLHDITDEAYLPRLRHDLAGCALVIDAVLGTGRARPMEGVLYQAMTALRQVRGQQVRGRGNSPHVLALDLPSGLDADTGKVDRACPPADVTASLGFPKAGHFRFPGADYVGRLEVLDIGIPERVAPEMSEELSLELMTAHAAAGGIPDRPLDSHKGTFGHALVMGGSRHFVGAAYLASQAAVRVGPGLVTVAAPQGIHPMLASKLSEVIHLPLPEDAEGRLCAASANACRDLLSRYDAVAIGCGMGRSDGGAELLRELLTAASARSCPLLIDADGLNNLSTIPRWWQAGSHPLVLTPHPGEMATLTGLTTAEVQEQRVEVAREYAAKWGTTVVLKGAYTVVASEDGRCYMSPFTNPGLASGGTGDVLSGIIVGLLAQGVAPADAALAGVYLHGMAAEDVRAELGEAGMLASDLLPKLPVVVRRLAAAAPSTGS